MHEGQSKFWQGSNVNTFQAPNGTWPIKFGQFGQETVV